MDSQIDDNDYDVLLVVTIDIAWVHLKTSSIKEAKWGETSPQ